MFVKQWYKDFKYEFIHLVNGEWKTTLRGMVIAKNTDDALKKIRKKVDNREFDKLLIEQTGDAVYR